MTARTIPKSARRWATFHPTTAPARRLLLSESVHTWFYAYDGDQLATAEFEPGYDINRAVKDTFTNQGCTAHLRLHLEEQSARRRTDQRRQELRQARIRTTFRRTWRISPRPATADVPLYESYGYPSSGHPNGVNVAFCGGQVDFMADSVEPTVVRPN